MTTKNEYTCTCIKCGKEYKIYCTENQYKNGKYRKTCSSSCANSRTMTEEKRQKIKEGVNSYIKKNKSKTEYNYICDKCGKKFVSKVKIRNDRHKHCEDCKQYREHAINPTSILDVSKRTVTKILQRANKGCSICG